MVTKETKIKQENVKLGEQKKSITSCFHWKSSVKSGREMPSTENSIYLACQQQLPLLVHRSKPDAHIALLSPSEERHCCPLQHSIQRREHLPMMGLGRNTLAFPNYEFVWLLSLPISLAAFMGGIIYSHHVSPWASRPWALATSPFLRLPLQREHHSPIEWQWHYYSCSNFF